MALEEIPKAVGLTAKGTDSVGAYVKSGAPYVWITAAAISASVIVVVSLLFLIASRGMPHFWPADVVLAEYQEPGQPPQPLLAEIVSTETVSSVRLKNAGMTISDSTPFHDRVLFKVGNRDLYGSDFRYLLDDWVVSRSYPDGIVVIERMEWGNFYGHLMSVKQGGQVVASGVEAFAAWQPLQDRANQLRADIRKIEKNEIGAANYALERMRLDRRQLEINGKSPEKDPEAFTEIEERRAGIDAEYAALQTHLSKIYEDISRDAVVVKTVDGQELEIPLSKIVHAYQPNGMSVLAKLGAYFGNLWTFASDDPREANTEGGIFPAIFGTVMMVMLMSVIVTPFGVVAAVYLREYARDNWVTRTVRIAVNNLAGVPSIVFGMFGLGFFVYIVGANIDQVFYAEALPSPTFGTPGILWASLTLALLTLPVVIVSTEEGLARIPRALREASLSLGATKAETLWRVVLPMASPAMMTGLILAVARAAGEVAPLMLVGVVKLAPSLPLDGNFPFMHLERKFMHLGFHIYDVGFQSPNVEAARPLVYATAFLLVAVIVLLNLAAIRIRNRLRERYKALDH